VSVIEESIGKKCVSQLATHEVVSFVNRRIVRYRRRKWLRWGHSVTLLGDGDDGIESSIK